MCLIPSYLPSADSVYLLLRDGHAISPARNLTLKRLKKARSIACFVLKLTHKARQTLNAIVDRLGFAGDFGTFLNKGWPGFNTS